MDPLDIVGEDDLVLLPSLIRLAFHDCSGTGVCDGCIDITNNGNLGLNEGAVQPLKEICQEYKTNYGLSIADCWALAGTFAVELSGDMTADEWALFAMFDPPQTTPIQAVEQGDIPYYIGRKDTNTLSIFW